MNDSRLDLLLIFLVKINFYVLLIRGVRLDRVPIGTLVTIWPIVPAPGGR
jgi:hypothetical protein